VLRVVEQYSLTDVGRQRNANEDALFAHAEAGLFAVADGMGGARAGEVAAKAAVDELAALEREDSVAEGELAAVVAGANKRIHELSQVTKRSRGWGRR
jgi:serine/threonine protein phosphatase PrpC